MAAFQTKPPAPDLPSPDKAPPDTLLDDLRKLYVQMPYSDVTFQVIEINFVFKVNSNVHLAVRLVGRRFAATRPSSLHILTLL